MTLKVVSEEMMFEQPEYVARDVRRDAGQDGSAAYQRQTYRSAETDYPPRPAQPFVFPTQEVIAVLTAISAILGARFALLLGGGGALWLAVLAMTAPNASSLWAQAIFSLTVFLPLVFLSARRSI